MAVSPGRIRRSVQVWLIAATLAGSGSVGRSEQAGFGGNDCSDIFLGVCGLPNPKRRYPAREREALNRGRWAGSDRLDLSRWEGTGSGDPVPSSKHSVPFEARARSRLRVGGDGEARFGGADLPSSPGPSSPGPSSPGPSSPKLEFPCLRAWREGGGSGEPLPPTQTDRVPHRLPVSPVWLREGGSVRGSRSPFRIGHPRLNHPAVHDRVCFPVTGLCPVPHWGRKAPDPGLEVLVDIVQHASHSGMVPVRVRFRHCILRDPRFLTGHSADRLTLLAELWPLRSVCIALTRARRAGKN